MVSGGSGRDFAFTLPVAQLREIVAGAQGWPGNRTPLQGAMKLFV